MLGEVLETSALSLDNQKRKKKKESHDPAAADVM
jgi:hypothetical protein